MKTKWISFFPALLVIALCGCSPQVITRLVGDYEAIPVDSVVVLGKQDPVPEAAEELGWVQVGNTGFTRDAAGTPRAVMTIAKDKAAAKGGNVLKVTEHWPPDWNSTTRRIHLHQLGGSMSSADMGLVPTPFICWVLSHRQTPLHILPGVLVMVLACIGTSAIYGAWGCACAAIIAPRGVILLIRTTSFSSAPLSPNVFSARSIAMLLSPILVWAIWVGGRIEQHTSNINTDGILVA